MADLRQLTVRRHAGRAFGAGAGSDAWTTDDEDLYLALFDPVTGLPKRVLMRDRLDNALARARRAQSFVAVFHVVITVDNATSSERTMAVVDIDRLCAERLCAGVRVDDSVGRVAEHEFVVVCHDIVDKEHSSLILRRFLDAFETPLAMTGTEQPVRAHVGVAIAYGTESAPPLMERARRSARIASARAT